MSTIIERPFASLFFDVIDANIDASCNRILYGSNRAGFKKALLR